MRKISILGATGSIGTQTLEVLRFHKGEFELLGISAHKSVDKVIGIVKEFSPKVVAITEKEAYEELKNRLIKEGLSCNLVFGMEGLKKVASLDEVDMVVTSVVGMIGLEPTLEAIRHKKDIALANKETLVVAGELIMREAKNFGVKILPVDSEHSAIYQCLQGNENNKISKVILTASGGPFRGKNLEFLKSVKVGDALKHPKWTMGAKISIDSSTLMNKGLEVIEAHFLFNCDYDNIQVVVHPQSIIHSMVEYTDGSVIAQLGTTDMRLAIQYALNYKERKGNVAGNLDFYKLKELTFEEPDFKTFKCLALAYKAGKIGKLLPAIMNGANEACVDLFLNEKIRYLDIVNTIEECMENFDYNKEVTLENVINIDKEVRKFVYSKWS
ncbi:1-deoxy-D-xylulose 5-phosphate reductoisomerase [Clostridium cavendishii DSM 21758]|uniref:1-deoxy-D-xylulose 5-phosphate reductoisomerase n=1 Tax=Clostridium cavendishii DSM 21758 TaxID=1121302 RepID=A0A1M6RLA6_9CLOT|nr:1-deoxy-D-xylulose-5-phosphate reductoisomerase [Clostridium cavendishii]SHK33232.1 1-deoxy-D-xylulose 5-phosphate reductoisomerase [Clostridium cavendishii DSM 21758]